MDWIDILMGFGLGRWHRIPSSVRSGMKRIFVVSRETKTHMSSLTELEHKAIANYGKSPVRPIVSPIGLTHPLNLVILRRAKDRVH